jgi:hypothetical protein
VSESAPSFEPPFAALVAVESNEPAAEISLEPHWPDLSFDFLDRHIFSDGLPVAPPARLRTVARAITELAPLSAAQLQGKPVGVVREEMDKYLKLQVSVGKDQLARRRFINPEVVCKIIWDQQLEPVNHPIVQAWTHVQSLNQHRIGYNRGGHAEIAVLSGDELTKLAVDLTLTLKQQAVKDFYEKRVSEARSVSRAAQSKHV